MVTDDSVRVDGFGGRCDTFGMPKIPVRREEITVESMNDRLSGTGSCRVTGLNLEEMTGHNPVLSQLFRVRIKYSSKTPGHPDVVIVKIPPVDDEIRLREAAQGPYTSEVGAYKLLGSFQGGAIARMYSVVEDRDEQTACFVFEDLGSLQAGQKYAQIDLAIARSAVGSWLPTMQSSGEMTGLQGTSGSGTPTV